MNKHYEHIRKICIAKNPSILDLACGCDVQRFSLITDTLLHIEAYWKWVSYTIRKWTDGMLFSEKTTNDVIEDWVILWRPITLQDVLLALDYWINNYGNFILWRSGTSEEWLFEYTDIIYNLSKPFHEQSDEFYKWCAEQLWYEEWRTLEKVLTPENIERAVKESTQDQEDFLREKWII